MKKYLHILFLVLFSAGTLLGNNTKVYFNTEYPNYVPIGQKYQVSSLFRIPNINTFLKLSIHSDYNTSLESVIFRNKISSTKVNFKAEDNFGDLGKTYSIILDDTLALRNYINQLVFTFSSKSDENSKFSFSYSIPSLEDSVLVPGVNKDLDLHSVSFYKPQKSIAGKSLAVQGKGYFQIDKTLYQIDNYRYFGFEFWLNTNIKDGNFLSIIDNSDLQKLLSLSLTKFGIISSSTLLDADFFNDYFISDNSWYHLLIVFDKKENKIKVYCNDTLFVVFNNDNAHQLKDYSFIFENPAENAKLEIDKLIIFQSNSSLHNLFYNKHFVDFTADSTVINYSENFDDFSLSHDYKDISFNNIKIIDSTAPLFSKAPELNVTITNDTYQIQWSSSKLAKVARYVVQKSYDGKNFFDIYTNNLVKSGQTDFLIPDVDNTKNEIIYYRIKQVNQDESVVYSSTVKVGRGKQIHFSVDQNYPNPFNPMTTVTVEVKEAADFEVKVFDIVGKLIATLFQGHLNPGPHQFAFNAVDLPSGLYLCEVKSRKEVIVTKMILTK